MHNHRAVSVVKVVGRSTNPRQHLFGRIQEIFHIASSVETNYVRVEDTFANGLSEGENGKEVFAWEWRVEEESDLDLKR